MESIKELFNYYREHKGATLALVCATIVGGVLGVIAYFNGWLG